MKKWVLRGICFLLTFLTALLIFSFSAETGEESGGMSGKIADAVLSVFDADGNKASAEYEKLKEGTEGVIRTLAHFGEYLLLGLFSSLLLKSFDLKTERVLLGAVGFSILYAILDEWHQSYVPGRVADLRDVLTDGFGAFCGALAGIFLWRACALIAKKMKERNRKGG